MRQFDKNVTSQMKALALLLMLVHHLWKHHEMVHYGPLSYSGILEQIGLFGKICVGIFLFLSGYGLMASAEIRGGQIHVVRRLKKILPPFWLIVVLAAPYLLSVGAVGMWDVLTDALLITHKMNGSWWFMQTYVIFVLCFPWIRKTLCSGKVWIPLLAVSLVAFQPLAAWVRPHSEFVHYILHHFPLFYAGVVAYRFGVVGWIDDRRWIEKAVITVAVLGLRFATGLHIMNIGIMMMMIVWLMDMQAFIPEKAKKVLAFLGAMSMNMWLTHQFFIDYGWHSTNPFLDLLVLYAVNLVLAWVLTGVCNKIFKT